MKMDKNDRNAAAVEVASWITSCPEDAELLLDADRQERLSPLDHLRLIESLQEKGLEFLIPIFLYISMDSCVMDSALSLLKYQCLTMQMEISGFENTLEEVKNNIRMLQITS